MRFRLAQPVFARLLQAASRIVPSRSPLPIASGVLLHARDGWLEVTATDLEMSATLGIPAGVEEPGEAVLPARFLTDLVRRAPATDLELSSSGEALALRLAWPDADFVIQGMSPEEFPRPGAFPEGAASVSVPGAALARAVRRTVFAASQDQARPILTGILLELGRARITAMATDGFRIARQEVFQEAAEEGGAEESAAASAPAEAAGAAPGDFGALVVPARSLDVLVSLGETEEEIQVASDGTRLHARGKGFHFVASLLQGSYPQVLAAVPAHFPSTWQLDRQELLDACERVALLGSGREQAPLKLQFGDGRLVVTADAPELGRAREALPPLEEGEPLEIAFNPRFWMEGLKALEGERVQVEMSGPLSAARLRDPEDSSFFYVVMPMRTAS
ncbi:MAG: DNA polymerase III subunit beta [Bacillota bacterium]|nr:DNA polymerase III subunit beta [Bacillota bacterium]